MFTVTRLENRKTRYHFFERKILEQVLGQSASL